MQHLESATRSSACAPLARWLLRSATVLLTLAAPVVPTWRALTTGHTGLTYWGIVLIAASLIGAAVGMLVAAPPRTASPARTMARHLPTQSRSDPQRPSAGKRAPLHEGSSYLPLHHRPEPSGRTSPPGPAAESAQRRSHTRSPAAPSPDFPSGPSRRIVGWPATAAPRHG
jgi:hypothetical protein